MNRLFVGLACAACVLLGITVSARRVVDYPWINFASKAAFDISKVELTDTATILHFTARCFPDVTQQLTNDAVIKADGKTFKLKGADNITPGLDVMFPGWGELVFSLSFEPVPEDTQMLDFYSSPGLWLSGIDLSGKPLPDFPEGVPEEVCTFSGDSPVPEPSFTTGETVLNFHLRPYLPEFPTECIVAINFIDGRQEHYKLNFDDEGNATVKFMQYGTCVADVADMAKGGAGYAQLTVLPGETLDCWLDSRISGTYAMIYRDNALSRFSRAMHNGYYGDFDRMYQQAQGIGFGPGSVDFGDYHFTGREYLDYVKDLYLAYTDTIASLDLSPMEKEYQQLSLQNETLKAIADYRDILTNLYRFSKNDPIGEVPADSVPAILSADDYREVTGWFDMSNPKLLMDPVLGRLLGKIDWNTYGAPGDLSRSLNMARRMTDKARERKLKQEDGDSLRSMTNPFFHTLGDSIYSIMAHEIELVKANSAIFDSIVAPHRGKVVVVDLWDTWCGPCRRALALNEPLKDGVLCDEDIVWIYIADESSDPEEYERLKQGIKGIHYLLDKHQMQSIDDRFKVDGIPYYIIVDREGNEEGRPDLRDHNLYISEIKSKLKK